MTDETITILRRDLEIAAFALKSILNDVDMLFAGYERKLASWNDEREALARLEEALKPCKVAELTASPKARCQCHIEAGDSPCDVHGEEFMLSRKALEVARFLLVMQVDHIDGKNNALEYWPSTDDFRRALAAVEEALKQ